VLTRLETMAMMADVGIPLVAMRSQIASAINVVLQVARLRDGSRKVTHISEIAGFDLDRGAYHIRDLYLRRVTGLDADGRVLSDFYPTGVLPSMLEHLQAHGYDLPSEMYDAARRHGAGDHAERHQ
jgi:pilus assembly protein CpaF